MTITPTAKILNMQIANPVNLLGISQRRTGCVPAFAPSIKSCAEEHEDVVRHELMVHFQISFPHRDMPSQPGFKAQRGLHNVSRRIHFDLWVAASAFASYGATSFGSR